MTEEHIPVYSIHDLAKSEAAINFEVTTLDNAFLSARQDVLNPHRHDFFEVFWIERGSGSLTIDFEVYEIRPPMILLFSPGRVHAWQTRQTPTGFVIRFGAEFFAAEAGDAAESVEMPIFYTIGGDPVLYLDESQNEQFEMLTGAIFREYCGNGIERLSALRSYLRLWLICAKRIAERERPQHNQTAAFYLTRRFLMLVEQNYQKNLSVENYAHRLQVSPAHLSSTVKQNMNKTAGEIVRERMLIEAKRLLRFSELTVSEIAFHLNFEDPSYFARFFRRHALLTPTDFRQQS